jgi:hypothetical protein
MIFVDFIKKLSFGRTKTDKIDFAQNRSDKPTKPIASIQIFCQFKFCTGIQPVLSIFDETNKTFDYCDYTDF